MQKFKPFLWFDSNAEEAVNFYVSLFPDSAINSISRYGEGMPKEAGSVMTVGFRLLGQEFIALNGGPYFTFTPAISFFVTCEDQVEVDRYWEALLDGGQTMQCGWITDKFGITWQIVPKVLQDLLADDDQDKVHRVTHAMLSMVKLDAGELLRAAEEV